MAKVTGPRHGSMQYWPRKRATSETPRVRARVFGHSPIDGFYGYKVGMTHVMAKDSGSNSLTKGQVISVPVTVVECPPLKVAGVRFYKKESHVLSPCGDVFGATDKELQRSFNVPKAGTISDDVAFDELRLLVYTQPKLTSIGKKTPEFFEVSVKGKKDEQLAYVKEVIGKEIAVSDIFNEHDMLDVHGVTTGKGFQGPVKRFGVQLRAAKSEKVKRGPGSLGPWNAQQHIMYRVAHAGQTGYHLRVEYNKSLLKIGTDVSEINPDGGFVRYGNVKNTYLLISGSVPGPRKRMLRLAYAARPHAKKKTDKLAIQSISTISRQR